MKGIGNSKSISTAEIAENIATIASFLTLNDPPASSFFKTLSATNASARSKATTARVMTTMPQFLTAASFKPPNKIIFSSFPHSLRKKALTDWPGLITLQKHRIS